MNHLSWKLLQTSLCYMMDFAIFICSSGLLAEFEEQLTKSVLSVPNIEVSCSVLIVVLIGWSWVSGARLVLLLFSCNWTLDLNENGFPCDWEVSWIHSSILRAYLHFTRNHYTNRKTSLECSERSNGCPLLSIRIVMNQLLT